MAGVFERGCPNKEGVSSAGVRGMGRLLAEEVLEDDSSIDSSQEGMVSEVRLLGGREE